MLPTTSRSRLLTNPALGVIGGRGRREDEEVDALLFGLQSPEEGTQLSQEQALNGHVEVLFAQDQYAATDRVTLNGGIRVTHFSGALSENAVSPRVGLAFRVPGVEWAVRASFGKYYQPPPLVTVAGPLLDVAAEAGFGFLPLQGERDDQYEVGVAIPIRGWAIDTDYFRTNARNFFDHDAIGNSNIFLPLTIDEARIRGGKQHSGRRCASACRRISSTPTNSSRAEEG